VIRSGCVDQSWWGGRLACMADSLVKHVICFSIHVKPLKPVIKVDSDRVPSKLRAHDPAAQQSSIQR
jgi:hypothetical protein